MADARAEVVICGGGVIGAAIAYFLGKRGVRSLIVEADGIASGASGAAAGLLAAPPAGAGDSPPAELQRRSLEMHEALASSLPEESGVDYGYARYARVALATTDEEEVARREAAARAQASGRDARWLDPSEVTELCPWIDRPGRGGLLSESASQLDPYRYTLALIAAAERMGSATRSGRVTGLERSGDRVTAVRVGDGMVAGDAIVIAMGPWSVEAGSWLGLPVPVVTTPDLLFTEIENDS